MPLKLTLREGTNIAERFGVETDRAIEIYRYLDKMVRDHTLRKLDVVDTLFEISIDPYFKTDAELTVAIFIIGGMKRSRTEVAKPLVLVKQQLISMARERPMDFLHLLGDRDGILGMYSDDILVGLKPNVVERDALLMKMKERSVKLAEVIFDGAANDGERIFIAMLVVQGMAHILVNTYNEAEQIVGKMLRELGVNINVAEDNES